MNCSACNERQEALEDGLCVGCQDLNLEYDPDYDLMDQDDLWKDIVTHLDEDNRFEFEEDRFNFDDCYSSI